MISLTSPLLLKLCKNSSCSGIQGKVGFICCALQRPKSIAGEETLLCSVTERKISHGKLGLGAMGKKQVPVHPLEPGGHGISDWAVSACLLLSGRVEFGQPPEDLVHPVINTGAKWNIVYLFQHMRNDERAQRHGPFSLVVHGNTRPLGPHFIRET